MLRQRPAAMCTILVPVLVAVQCLQSPKCMLWCGIGCDLRHWLSPQTNVDTCLQPYIGFARMRDACASQRVTSHDGGAAAYGGHNRARAACVQRRLCQWRADGAAEKAPVYRCGVPVSRVTGKPVARLSSSRRANAHCKLFWCSPCVGGDRVCTLSWLAMCLRQISLGLLPYGGMACVRLLLTTHALCWGWVNASLLLSWAGAIHTCDSPQASCTHM